MKKISFILCFCLIFPLFPSCQERPNYADEIRDAYREAERDLFSVSDSDETAESDSDDSELSDEDSDIINIDLDFETNEGDSNSGTNDDDLDSETNDNDSKMSGDPCDPNPCPNISHIQCRSFGVMGYECICEDGWYRDGDSCVNPCEKLPCGEQANSTTSHIQGCRSLGITEYVCICEDGWYWDGDSCVNPCDNALCGEQANSTGECIPLSPRDYNCVCKESYFWNGEKCAELPECSRTSGTPCRDSSTGLTWSSLQSAYDLLNKPACISLSEGGISDWQLASIGELRSLIIECPATMLGSFCEVSEECRSESCYSENCQCDLRYNGQYGKLGDIHLLISSTPVKSSFDSCWYIKFSSAFIGATSCHNCVFTSYGPLCGGIDMYFRCARCDKGYFWYKDKCIKSPCVQDPCKNVPNAIPDSCDPKTETTFDCWCEKNYYWNGSECFLDPCSKEPCKNIPHADPEWCNHSDETTFECKCDENYVWNGSACVPSKCFEEPCKDIPHAYNRCTPVNEEEYYCSCKKSYDWGGESYEWDGEKCISPCDSKPCDGLPYSDGVCDVTTAEIYVCGCKEPAYWDQKTKRCVNSCPCASDPNSTGVCSSKNNGPNYSCQCLENHIWSPSLKKCVACSEGLCNIPHSDGTCKNRYTSEDSYECGCVDGYVWNESKKRCIISCKAGEFVNGKGECVNPCDTDLCSSIPHATGECQVSGATYDCLCEDGYLWGIYVWELGIYYGCFVREIQ